MQNNVTELTQKLLRSLDKNYNVIDMPAVVEIISLLEEVSITKELLGATRLGKYINELRRKTTDEALSKRAKELVKKWRSTVLPDSNGQVKQSSPVQQEDVNLNQLKIKKRPAKEPPDITNIAKRPKMNGGTSELDFSDNSNSSFKDVIPVKTEPKRDIIIINSDSNSSIPDKHDPQLDQQMPKKRGRKKGSRNHRNLLDEAESSFTSKLAVSRGNSKVKTTQELLASLQNKSSSLSINSLNVKPKEDLIEKAAKLTQRVSIIDQQLNTNANRNKNTQRNKFKLEKIERVIESGSVINDKSLLSQNSSAEKEDEEEVIVVDAEQDDDIKTQLKSENENQETENSNIINSLSVEDALAQLPPIDKSVLLEEDNVQCNCILKEVPAGEDAEVNLGYNTYEFVEDHCCDAKLRLTDQYRLNSVTDEQVYQLSSVYLPNINGNSSVGPPKPGPVMQNDGLYENVVPNVNIEQLPKDVKNFSTENFSKYNFSENYVKSDDVERTDDQSSDNSCFREWFEVVERPSYNGETLKILPYVIID